jgi:thioredoxin reductase (NADPH)
MSDLLKLRIVGHRWAKHSHAIKDFLGRNQVPFSWVDLDHGTGGWELLTTAGAGEAELPVVLFPDGSHLADPSIEQLAEKMGMHTHADRDYYDLAVVGGGPAGLAAAVYGSSEGFSTVLIEREAIGGQAGTSSRIENYLGFPEGVSGGELAQRGWKQALRLGAEVVEPVEVTDLRVEQGYKHLTLSDDRQITCHALIVATGVAYRALPAPGLERLAGAGVYYGAATTEAQSAEDEHVFVVGAGNSAGQGARYFSRFADRVTMLVKGPDLTEFMSQYLIDQIDKTPNIEVMADRHVVEAKGDQRLESLVIEDTITGSRETVPAQFLFIFIGAEPRNPWLGDLVKVDEHGFILTGHHLTDDELTDWPLERPPLHQETSVPGIFAAGDIRHGSIRRVAGAVGEGSTCVQMVHRYMADG